LTHRLLLDRIGEVLGYFEIDVGIQKCSSHLFQRLGHIDFRNAAVPFEDVKRLI
jgi:uncharacterized protein YabN with tetrapyrrole methylase and pyrophosphatase domain